MSKNIHKANADKDTVLLVLDQLSQTMDVMRQVVGRLKHSVEVAAQQSARDDRHRRDMDQAKTNTACRGDLPFTVH